jgi:hypothetical protein
MHQDQNPDLVSVKKGYQTLNSIFRPKLKEMFYQIKTDAVNVHNRYISPLT